ncbi:hypothetical protein EGM88_10770 [Aureibaculum marinum]|uniref:Toxin-antitoxin system YwqK family antitoxin n=1 Tax=Aureibaculum marinum TaxID=2487930 RepID=A0A3N4NII6_9FLAO|nr:hypothetical protein [Aureibaculum marinum]RPD96164.1 hypothetical protein EGM88_10770 [Aureibaculum marinum]
MQQKQFTIGIFLTLTLYFSVLNAQNDTIYYDDQWNETTKSNASFYRPMPLEQEGNKVLIKDYYSDGTLQFKAWQILNDTTEVTSLGSGTYYDGKVVWYYANGNKKTEMHYKNKKQNGAEITYYKNGAVKSEYQYIDGQLQLSKFYSPEGKLVSSLKYKNGYPEEGISNCFVEYKNGKKVGEKLYYQDTNILAYERVCSDKGCYNLSTETYYNLKGQILQINKVVEERIVEGKAIDFFKGNSCGYVKGIKSITEIEHGNFNGSYTKYDVNGKVMYTGIYKDNLSYEGTFETTKNYLTYITNYENGLKIGKEIVYNKEKKIAEGFYSNGNKQNGTFVEARPFTDWSKTPIIINLKDGKEEGKQKFYNVARDLTIGYYHAKQGIKEGEYKVFDYDGEVLAEAIYKDDKPFDGEILFNDEYKLYKNGERVRENVVIDSIEQQRMEAFSKGSDTVEGIYNMGGFEMASSIVFLDTHQFFFSLSVGSLDLVTYGAYHLKNGILKLQVPLEHKQDFVIYGKNDKSLKDTIQITYYNYNAHQKPLVQLNKQWYTLEDITQQVQENSSRSKETFKIHVNKLSNLNIGIKNATDSKLVLNELLEAETLNNFNSFIIAYNVSSKEIKQFEKATFTFNGENLVSDGKEKKKRSLSATDKENVLDYIIENRAFPYTIQHGSYQKIKLNAKVSKQKIKKYIQLKNVD